MLKELTDQAVAAELGRRIEQLRLEQNRTQQAMADAIGISRISYGKLEAGEAKFINVIAALRELGQLHILEQLLPATSFSPMQLLKMQGKTRQRARNKTQVKAGTKAARKIQDDNPNNKYLNW